MGEIYSTHAIHLIQQSDRIWRNAQFMMPEDINTDSEYVYSLADRRRLRSISKKHESGSEGGGLVIFGGYGYAYQNSYKT